MCLGTWRNLKRKIPYIILFILQNQIITLCNHRMNGEGKVEGNLPFLSLNLSFPFFFTFIGRTSNDVKRLYSHEEKKRVRFRMIN